MMGIVAFAIGFCAGVLVTAMFVIAYSDDDDKR